MRSLYPQFKPSYVDGNLVFQGNLIVKPEWPPYKVRIVYRGKKEPRVYLDPLPKRNKHLYKEGCLCLYHPENYRWSADKLIAKDIVPWTAAWIYFYEYWLQTGEWICPEVPHANTTNSIKNM